MPTSAGGCHRGRAGARRSCVGSRRTRTGTCRGTGTSSGRDPVAGKPATTPRRPARPNSVANVDEECVCRTRSVVEMWVRSRRRPHNECFDRLVRTSCCASRTDGLRAQVGASYARAANVFVRAGKVGVKPGVLICAVGSVGVAPNNVRQRRTGSRGATLPSALSAPAVVGGHGCRLVVGEFRTRVRSAPSTVRSALREHVPVAAVVSSQGSCRVRS